MSQDKFYEIYNLIVLNRNNLKFEEIETTTQEEFASVEFDYNKVYMYEDHPDYEVIGFKHTHPKGMNEMSEIDIETMNTWVKCLSKPLLCIIQSGIIINYYVCYGNYEYEKTYVTLGESR